MTNQYSSYRGDIAGMEFWSIFQEGEARVCIYHILKKIVIKTKLINIRKITQKHFLLVEKADN